MTRRPGTRAVWSAGLVLALLLGVQAIPVDRVNPPVEADVAAPVAVRNILVQACFDCHSHETRWPWYSRIAPVSWWTASHVRAGRRDLNFSRWPILDFTGQDLILRDIDRVVSSGAMPPRSYRLAHPAARLSGPQKDALLDWARAGRAAQNDRW